MATVFTCERGDDGVGPDRMDTSTKERLRHAADRAGQRYPGPVGELLRQELLSWMVFGHLLGSALIMQVADELIRRPQPAPGTRLRNLPEHGGPVQRLG